MPNSENFTGSQMAKEYVEKMGQALTYWHQRLEVVRRLYPIANCFNPVIEVLERHISEQQGMLKNIQQNENINYEFFNLVKKSYKQLEQTVQDLLQKIKSDNNIPSLSDIWPRIISI